MTQAEAEAAYAPARPTMSALLISAIFFAIACAGCGMLILFGFVCVLSLKGNDIDWQEGLSMMWVPFALFLGVKNAKIARRFAYTPHWRAAGWYLLMSCLTLATSPFMWIA
jgi:hypothetical protein